MLLAPSTTHATHVVAGIVIENGIDLATRGQGPRHLGATCATCASLSVFERPTTSSSMTVTTIPVFGWSTLTSHAGQARRTKHFDHPVPPHLVG
jgi:hypothetical protein